MSGFYGEEQVEQLKAKVDLVDLFASYTVVKKSGSDHVACCPLHQERSPSLHIYEDGHWHCFGCNETGDCIDLVVKRERLDFRDAVEFLARRVGMTLVPVRGGQRGPDRAKREVLLAAVEFATAWQERQLWSPAGAEALAYMRGRGFTDATLQRYRIGWAPGRGLLMAAARAAGIDAVDLVTVNLATEREDRCTDRFFDRVMFPICDRFGQPIAFSGRLLPEAERRMKAEGRGVGKYVNSTDTPHYHKGSVIWNLHRAREAARTSNRILVMEGPTDVMAADQAGFPECTACLGTALTADHCKLLDQTVGSEGQILIVLDGDAPGLAAAAKAARTILAAGIDARVVTVPEGLDIAELLAQESAT